MIIEKLVIGVDIGGTRTKVGLVDLTSGRVIGSTIAPTEKESAARFENGIEMAIRNLMSSLKMDYQSIQGVGFGVPSFVWENGIIDSTYGFLPFMEDYPLSRIMEGKLGLPCRIENDASAIALGEALYGQGREYSRMLLMTLGTGLGLGFTRDGKLTERLSYAHMGGHLKITDEEIICYCGKKGCLESLVSATGLRAAAERAGWHGRSTSPATTENILEAARLGEPVATAVVKQWLSYLKTGIDNFIGVYAPDIIVLGGGVAKGLTDYLPLLTDNTLLRPFKKYNVKITISTLNEQAGILGSAALFTQ